MSAPKLTPIITIAWCLARWIAARIDRAPPDTWPMGDIARLPEELATGGERFAGGRAAKATRRINHGLALHDKGGK